MFKRLFLSALILMTGCFIGNIANATVSSTTSKIIYNGDNFSTSFNFNYPLYAATDLQVFTIVVATGVTTQLTLNSQYTVSLTPVPYTLSNSVVYYTAVVNLAGGSSPYGALPSGTNLVINRVLPYTNAINITDYSATPASTWNQAHDRPVMLAQQLQEQVNRSILGSIGSSSALSLPAPVANSLLCWNPTATGLINCSVPSITSNWLLNGSNIYYSAGSVGIGTSSPSTALQVVGTATATAFAGPLTGNVTGNASGTSANVTGVVAVANGGTGSTTGVGLFSGPYIKVSDSQVSGTGGGQGSVGSWQTAPLNTKDSDTYSIATLSNNTVVLPAGTYYVRSTQPFFRTGASQSRLYNSTGTAVILYGTSTNSTSAASPYSQVISVISGQFTISVTSTLILQYEIGNSINTGDLGVPVSYGTEVFAQLEFWKIQ